MVIAAQKRLPIESEFKLKPAVRANVAVKKFTLLTLVVLAGFALCMLYIYQATKVIAMGYQVDQAKSSVSELQRQNKYLELKKAELQAPERIEAVATAKLGMKEPQDYLIASYSPEQLSPQESQLKAPSPDSSWTGAPPAPGGGAGSAPASGRPPGAAGTRWARLLAMIPRFIGRAEASSSTQ